MVRPEGLADRLASATGREEDIDFESQEFSNRFHVVCNDRKFAYDLIHPRMMEHLLVHPDWAVEVAGTAVLLYSPRLWGAEEVRAALEFLTGFLDLVPEFVWKDVGAK